jgi:hypothetical protein
MRALARCQGMRGDWLPLATLTMLAFYGYIAVFPEKLEPLVDWLVTLTLP